MNTSAPILSPIDAEAAVAAERIRMADLVADLTAEQWATRSSCPAWTVRDVIAHLTVTTWIRVPRLLAAVLAARGDFDRVTIQLAAGRAAAHSTDGLVAELRRSAASTRRMPGSSPMDALMDLVIHGQDIARPLGLTYVTPPSVVTACLAYVAASRFMGGPARLAGVRVVATDSGWSSGAGPELSGPDVDLLLVASGRRSGLAGATGPGREIVEARMR